MLKIHFPALIAVDFFFLIMKLASGLFFPHCKQSVAFKHGHIGLCLSINVKQKVLVYVCLFN